MVKENNIVIISVDENFCEKLAEKIILLRKSDKIITAGYKNALQLVQQNGAVVVLLHADTASKTLPLIKELKDYTSIILLTENDDMVLDAYDAGITDFCSCHAADYELVIRVVNCIKTAVNTKMLSAQKRLLVQHSILDKDSGFYMYKNAEQVINNELVIEGLSSGTFVVIAPGENSKPIFSTDKMVKAIKQSVRKDDIVTFGKEARYYILLPHASIDDAVAVVEKIKAASPKNCDIRAGLCDISGKNFVQLELEGLKAVLDAMYSNETYSIANFKDDSFDNNFDEAAVNSNNYKLFRQIYKKKLEKVIIPVFYRVQMDCEDKMSDTEVFQFAENDCCVFRLKNSYQDSMLKIFYPGFAKIIVNIHHKGLESPENKEIKLSLSKLNTNSLQEIIEGFIEEFKTTAVK